MASLIPLVDLVFRALQFLVLARVIVSWVPAARYHPAGLWIARVADPLLRPFRALLPVGAGGIDFSPVILLIVLIVAREAIVRLLIGL